MPKRCQKTTPKRCRKKKRCRNFTLFVAFFSIHAHCAFIPALLAWAPGVFLLSPPLLSWDHGKLFVGRRRQMKMVQGVGRSPPGRRKCELFCGATVWMAFEGNPWCRRIREQDKGEGLVPKQRLHPTSAVERVGWPGWVPPIPNGCPKPSGVPSGGLKKSVPATSPKFCPQSHSGGKRRTQQQGSPRFHLGLPRS